jgi:hypothetical protein
MTQAYAIPWEADVKLDILEFQGCLQPEEFIAKEKIKKFDKKRCLERWWRLRINWRFVGNAWRSTWRSWGRICVSCLKPSLPKWPTWVVIMVITVNQLHVYVER